MTAAEALLAFMPKLEHRVRLFLCYNNRWVSLLHIDQQELIDESCVMFLNRYPHWRPDMASLNTWLDKAVYGTCMDYCERQADYSFRKCRYRPTGYPCRAVAYRRALASEMMDRIQALPDKERRVMNLIYRDGYNHREAGQRLHRTEGRVSQLHAQAVDQLRRAVA
jgi:RNA polymerase sigma factor (sigma-70 family)